MIILYFSGKGYYTMALESIRLLTIENFYVNVVTATVLNHKANEINNRFYYRRLITQENSHYSIARRF